MGRQNPSAALADNNYDDRPPLYLVGENFGNKPRPNEAESGFSDPADELSPHADAVKAVDSEIEAMRQNDAMEVITDIPVDGSLESFQIFLYQAGKYPLLRPGKEFMLAKRIEKGDLDAKELLTNSNLRLVVANAKRFQNQGLELSDLVQEGMLGLIRGVEKFDWRKGFRFSTYATLWIRQAMQRGLADKGEAIRIPVHIHQDHRKVMISERVLTVELGSDPTDQEIATKSKLPLVKVKRVKGLPRVAVSLNKQVGEDNDASFGDFLENEDPPVDEEVHEILKNEALRDAIAGLPDAQRAVIEMRFGINDTEPKTLSQVGREIGVSTERARQIEERALKRLRQHPELIALNRADKDESPNHPF